MIERLVLGSGPLARTLVDSLSDWPGSVRVVTDDTYSVTALRERGIDVLAADPTAEETLRRLDSADQIVVADDNTATNDAAARAARTVFPDAYLFVHADMTRQEHEGLREIADRVLDPGREVAGFVLDRLDTHGEQMQYLLRLLKGIDRIAVVTHDNPDPDAIASGVALATIAETVGCTADVCFYGEISHQENRAFVNLLDLDLRQLEADEDLSAFDGLALVDHSRPGVNDQLPVDASVDVVIDHHPPRSPVDARFVDLRSDVGATSTLLVDYLEYLDIQWTEESATALLFGIHVDTKGLTREVSATDFEAAATLIEHANLGTLERIESPSSSAGTLETIAGAIRNRRIERSVLMSCAGRLSNRDALAQAADRLLLLADVDTTLVYGVMDGTIYASARSQGTSIDIGEAIREAFGQIGSAGGHEDMAGAQITLGVLDAVEDREESLLEVVESVVTDRFLDTIDAYLDRTHAGVYVGKTDWSEDPDVAVPELRGTGEIDPADRDTGPDDGNGS